MHLLEMHLATPYITAIRAGSAVGIWNAAAVLRWPNVKDGATSRRVTRAAHELVSKACYVHVVGDSWRLLLTRTRLQLRWGQRSVRDVRRVTSRLVPEARLRRLLRVKRGHGTERPSQWHAYVAIRVGTRHTRRANRHVGLYGISIRTIRVIKRNQRFTVLCINDVPRA